MAKKSAGRAGSPLPAAKRGESSAHQHSPNGAHGVTRPTIRTKPSAFVDTRIVYCGDNLEEFKKLPDASVDQSYINSPHLQSQRRSLLG